MHRRYDPPPFPRASERELRIENPNDSIRFDFWKKRKFSEQNSLNSLEISDQKIRFLRRKGVGRGDPPPDSERAKDRRRTEIRSIRFDSILGKNGNSQNRILSENHNS